MAPLGRGERGAILKGFDAGFKGKGKKEGDNFSTETRRKTKSLRFAGAEVGADVEGGERPGGVAFVPGEGAAGEESAEVVQ